MLLDKRQEDAVRIQFCFDKAQERNDRRSIEPVTTFITSGGEYFLKQFPFNAILSKMKSSLPT